MALKDFLYRCPFCGHDPLEGKGLSARCPTCARTYGPGAGRTCFSVSMSGGEAVEVPGGELARRLTAFGGPVTRATGVDGGVNFASVVTARFSLDEEPLHREGVLLGFVERSTPPVRGRLRVDARHLAFEAERGEGRTWDLLDLRALQASSSSIQISPAEGGVVAFRLHSESTYRWEELLKERLRAVWKEAGRGEIVEFQPRMRAR